MVYADTSLIASCYIQDSMSATALTTLSGISDPIPVTALLRLEVRNATKLAVFRRRITPAESTAVWSDFLSDYRARKFVRVAIEWRGVFREAYKLASSHSLTLGTRSLDILHVAVAVALGAKTFLTFDKRQRALAHAVGLQVLP